MMWLKAAQLYLIYRLLQKRNNFKCLIIKQYQQQYIKVKEKKSFKTITIIEFNFQNNNASIQEKSLLIIAQKIIKLSFKDYHIDSILFYFCIFVDYIIGLHVHQLFITTSQLMMQNLISKICYYNTPNSRGDAFSPFAAYKEDIENKRSKLFPDRKRVPGRKTKFILTIVYLIHIYAVSKFLQQKRTYSNKAEQQRQIQRKVSPFFQSVEDIQFTTLKHRKDLILLQAFKNLGGASYLQKFNRFSNSDIFVPSSSGEVYKTWQKAGTGRYAESISNSINNRYLTGYNIQNV